MKYAIIPLIFASGAAATLGADTDLDWAAMAMGLFGGLALFLFGMEQMSDALKSLAGGGMKNLLAKLTTNRVSAAFTGTVVTAIIQSSSVTTVLVVGFVSAGLMTLQQSIGVIMGANIGTTITAHIVAFNVTKYALLMIAVGFFLLFFGKSDRARLNGNILMGLGMIFFGMGIMSEGMSPLREYQPFIDLMAAMENPLLGLLVAAAFTALVQSSSATTGILIVMASQGFITLPAGIAMAIGANVGTCITAILASLGKPTEARRAAAVHVVFNIAGGLLWIGFIEQLASVAVWISPSFDQLPDAERLAAETPRQIANANTIFNVINTALFLPFASLIAKLVERLVPERATAPTILVEPRFLDMALIETPALALHNVRLELGHMGDYVKEMFSNLRTAAVERDVQALRAVARDDDKVDLLQERILEYLGRLSRATMSRNETDSLQQLMNATVHLENAGDIVERELVPLLAGFAEGDQVPSDTIKELLSGMADKVSDSLGRAIDAVVREDQQLAQEVIVMKPDLVRTIDEIYRNQAGSLGEVNSGNIDVLRLEMELCERLRRLYTVARRLAKEVLPAEVAMKAESSGA